MSRDFLVVDFEFTTYKKRTGQPRGFFSEIIEIGAVKIDGETLESVDRVQHFVKPHFYPKQANEGLNFSMITKKDMVSAIEFSEMLEIIKTLYTPKKTYFTAWGNADYGVLNEGCKRHSLINPVLEEDYLDIAFVYKTIMEDTHTTGLRDAAEEQDIDMNGLWHTAYDDAAATGKILIKMIENGWLTMNTINKFCISEALI